MRLVLKYESQQIKSRVSQLTGAEIRERLHAVAWSEADFARFCGGASRTIYAYSRGEKDGKIPVLIEIALEYVCRHPRELQSRPELQTPIRQSRARQDAMLPTHVRTEPEQLMRRNTRNG